MSKRNKGQEKKLTLKDIYEIMPGKSVSDVCRDFSIKYDALRIFLKGRDVEVGSTDDILSSKIIALIEQNVKDIEYSVRIERKNSANHSLKQPRFGVLCVDYGISIDLAKEYLLQLGRSDIKSDTILKKAEVISLENKFVLDRNKVERIRRKYRFDYIETEEANAKAPTEDFREPFLYVERNIFDRVKNYISFIGFPQIESCFEDSEALNVCSKMASSFPRRICKEYQRYRNDNELRYQLHYLANKALTLYGGHVLSFMYSLRPLKFTNARDAEELITYSRVLPDFPIITLKTRSERFNVSFYLKQQKNGELKSDVVVYTKEHEKVGEIDEHGYLMFKLEKFRPRLNMFLTQYKENGYELFSGIESGYCIVCGRPLEDPKSIRLGIGPVCVEKYRIDSRLYQL